MAPYLRGELAKEAEIHIETLRFYEKNRLLPRRKRLSISAASSGGPSEQQPKQHQRHDASHYRAKEASSFDCYPKGGQSRNKLDIGRPCGEFAAFDEQLLSNQGRHDRYRHIT